MIQGFVTQNAFLDGRKVSSAKLESKCHEGTNNEKEKKTLKQEPLAQDPIEGELPSDPKWRR